MPMRMGISTSPRAGAGPRRFTGNQVRLIGRADPRRRQGRRVSRRREAALRHRLLVPTDSRPAGPLLQEWPGPGQAHAGDRGHGHEESGLDRHAGLRRRRPVVGREGRNRLRPRRRPDRHAAGDLRLRRPQGLTSIPAAPPGGRPPSSSCGWARWWTWCPRRSGRSRN